MIAREAKYRNSPQVASRLCLTPHSLLLISTLIYFSPALFGSFEYIRPDGVREEHTYSPEAIGLSGAIVVVLFCSAFVTRKSRLLIRVAVSTSAEAVVLGVGLLALGAYVVSSGHIAEIDKGQMLENTNRLHLAFYPGCTVGVLFCALTGMRRHSALLAISLLGLLLTLYIGHRSSLAITIIGVGYLKFRNSALPAQLGKAAVLGVSGLLVLALYKSVYVDVKSGNWMRVAERLSVENLSQGIRVGMEPFLTYSQFDFVVSSDFKTQCSSLPFIPICVLPFSDSLLSTFAIDLDDCSFSDQIKPVFYSGYSGGVGANIWAEFYSSFGVYGIWILVVVLSAVFGLIEMAIRHTRSPALLAGLIVALVNFAFYIQRKDFFGAFVSSKRVLALVLLVFVIARMLRGLGLARRANSHGWLPTRRRERALR